MSTITPFERSQEAFERAAGYIDNLIEQGKTRSEAMDHAVQRYGVNRARLAKLMNERDYGIMGNSGTTEISVVASPQGLMGTA